MTRPHLVSSVVALSLVVCASTIVIGLHPKHANVQPTSPFAATAAVDLTGTPPGALPYTRRFNLKGCGTIGKTTLARNQRVLFYNAGTAARIEHTLSTPAPQWPLKQAMWVESSWSGAGVWKITFTHVGCSSADVYTVTTT